MDLATLGQDCDLDLSNKTLESKHHGILCFSFLLQFLAQPLRLFLLTLSDIESGGVLVEDSVRLNFYLASDALKVVTNLFLHHCTLGASIVRLQTCKILSLLDLQTSDG